MNNWLGTAFLGRCSLCLGLCICDNDMQDLGRSFPDRVWTVTLFSGTNDANKLVVSQTLIHSNLLANNVGRVMRAG